MKWPAVRRILQNEVYLGILTQGKRGTPNYKVRVMREKDPDEWVRVEDTHEALISRDDFQSVQRMMGRDRRSAAAGAGTSGSLFSGFLF